MVAATGVLCHLAYSSLGFSLADDGFILAASRRLLNGEMPHRDFISIRPVGSALIHMPEVWLGGAMTFWLSRLIVWVEFTLIAWLWVGLAERARGAGFSWAERIALFLVALALTSHTFPLMAWHTVDGLVLATAGFWLVGSGGRMKPAGYALIGAALLCKQNFGPLGPSAILLFSDARRLSAWVAWAIPSLLYAVVLAAGGALSDAVVQLGTQTNLLAAGVLPYVTNIAFYSGVVLGLAMAAVAPGWGRVVGDPRRAQAVLVVLCLLLLGAGVTMNRADYLYLDSTSFLIFGLVLGLLLPELWRGRRDSGVRLTALALIVAWTASVSVGYRTPALASGPLAVVALSTFASADGAKNTGWRPRAAILALAVLLAGIWLVARREHVYHELPASELVYRLDDVLPGGRYLRTSHNTREVLSDLNDAVTKTGGCPYTIVTDFSAWWVRNRARNPLSIDWPQTVELYRSPLRGRIIGDLERLRGRGRIIAQKIYVMNVSSGFAPLGNDNLYYFAVAYVREHFHKVAETRWFEIYE